MKKLMLIMLMVLFSTSLYAKSQYISDWIPTNQLFEVKIDDFRIEQEYKIRGEGNNILVFRSKDKLYFDFSKCSPDNYQNFGQLRVNGHNISIIRMVVTSDTGGCLFTINKDITINYAYVTDY